MSPDAATDLAGEGGVYNAKRVRQIKEQVAKVEKSKPEELVKVKIKAISAVRVDFVLRLHK